jgi:hypothetical protein
MTIRQLFALSTGNKTGPLRLSTLRSAYKITGSMSLRSLFSKVEAGEIVLWVSIRDISLLTSAVNPSELASQWNTATPSKATLLALFQLLSSVGASIVYLSGDWRTVGIRGNMGSLTALASLRVVYQTNAEGASQGGITTQGTPEGAWGFILTGAGAVAGGVIAAGSALSVPAGADATAQAGGCLILLGAGALAAIGVTGVGYGIYDLVTSDTSQNVPESVDAGAPAQVGQAPDGVDPNNPPDTPYDAGLLPDNPPDNNGGGGEDGDGDSG